MNLQIIPGDCCETLKTIPGKSVQCCVTSPPYFGLRNYGHHEQIGLEATPQAYVETMLQVFGEIWRVLKDDGTLWMNLGDSYNAAGRVGHGTRNGCKQGTNRASATQADNCRPSVAELKPKDLIGIPWIVAFALRDAGWYLRQDIIWHKPNPMPESVTDRCTKSHEYLFLLAKSERYYFDAEAIKEPSESNRPDMSAKGIRTGLAYLQQGPLASNHSKGRTGKTAMRGQGHFRDGDGPTNRPGRDMSDVDANAGDERNKRDVWTVATSPYKEAHFATFPPDLIKPCILAGSKPGDLILDSFAGSGTTGMVALELGRRAILCELNPDYCKLIEQRTNVTPGLHLA